MSHRVPTSEFRARPWRIHEVAADFDVEDVWQLPGAEPLPAFQRVVEEFAGFEPSSSPLLVRLLWSARMRLGTWFGWDDPDDGIGGRVDSLRSCLPDDLRGASTRADLFSELPFDVLIDLPDEFAAEVANRTVHGVMHVGAVPAGDGLTHVQLTVLVKPNGWLGRAYLLGIKPFRYLFIYPQMIDELARHWHRAGATTHD